MSLPFCGTPHISNHAITGAADAVVIAAERPERISIIIQNQGADDVYLGIDDTVTSSGATRGYLLKGGQTVPDIFPDRTVNSAIYAYAATGKTGSLCVWETYR